MVPQPLLRNAAAALTSFVGRRPELIKITALLSSSRMVTLTGPGGVGKTRLAVQVASGMARRFSDGGCLVELALVPDPGRLADTVCAALGLYLPPGRRPLDALPHYLGDRQLLLVLDNCEHLLAPCAELVETLLRSCGGLRVLATTRQPIGVPGESVVEVAPLSVPDADRLPPLPTMAEYEAVSLFAERAAAAAPPFQLTAENAAAVAGICRRLDGLPLAIELTATWLRVVAPQQLLELLTDRVDLPDGGRAGVADRQRTLRSSIDWSFGLCSPAERELGWRLAVFTGWFGLDAAEAVCGGDGLAASEVPGLLAGLVDKSIVAREDAGDQYRYRMLETIRHYGLTQLQLAGTEEAVRRRHRQWYTHLLDRAVAEWMNGRDLYWYRRLRREQADVRAAIDFWLTEPGQAPAALDRLVTPPLGYYELLGRLFEAQLERALALVPEPGPVRARALLMAGHLAAGRGDLDHGAELVQAGRDLASRSGDASLIGFAGLVTGTVAVFRGDWAVALAETESGLAHLTGPADLAPRLAALTIISAMHLLAGEIERASACHQEVLALAESRGEHIHRSVSLMTVGVMTWLTTRDQDLAASLCQQCLSIRAEAGEANSFWTCFYVLAIIASQRRHHRRAATLLGIGHRLSELKGPAGVAVPQLTADVADCTRRSRAALGKDAYSAAHSDGVAMTDEQACAYALEDQPQAAPAARQPTTDVLTLRQRQVAELVAQGMGNPEIAATLGISRRTAESHVDAILRKLRLSSRTQITVWVGEHRAAQNPGRR